MKHINEITLDGESAFVEQFNICSELFMKAKDDSITEEQRKEYLEMWFQERQRLELGMY